MSKLAMQPSFRAVGQKATEWQTFEQQKIKIKIKNKNKRQTNVWQSVHPSPRNLMYAN